ncbi:MAG: hypothetical protein IJV64_03960, partial [Oscillospiraceae bacterium]|nr:hypothetical protein [Oscillospiraceae bacterium]
METIKKLAEMALEEAESACHYAKWSVIHKAEHPTLAETLFSISGQELNHAELLHKEAERLLAEHTGAEAYAACRAVVDYLHEEQVEKTNKAK